MLFPWNFIVNHVIQGTNASLKAAGVNKPVTIVEIRVFIEVWFLISLRPQYSQSHLFADGTRLGGTINSGITLFGACGLERGGSMQ